MKFSSLLAAGAVQFNVNVVLSTNKFNGDRNCAEIGAVVTGRTVIAALVVEIHSVVVSTTTVDVFDEVGVLNSVVVLSFASVTVVVDFNSLVVVSIAAVDVVVVASVAVVDSGATVVTIAGVVVLTDLGVVIAAVVV